VFEANPARSGGRISTHRFNYAAVPVFDRG